MYRKALGIVFSIVVLVACGSDPETPTLLVTDRCSYTGPETLQAGTARLTLQRSGLGDTGAAMVLLLDDHSADELRSHFEEVSPVWDERPDWARLRYVVEVDDSNTNSASGDTVLMSLEPGDHALVCIDYSDDEAEVAASIEVTAVDS